MYCPECDEEGVDFNSVAVTQSRPSFTGEIGETGIYGTAHTSKTNIVNVCKGCGCKVFYANKGEHLADVQAATEEKLASERFWRNVRDRLGKILGILGITAALIACLAILFQMFGFGLQMFDFVMFEFGLLGKIGLILFALLLGCALLIPLTDENLDENLHDWLNAGIVFSLIGFFVLTIIGMHGPHSEYLPLILGLIFIDF